MGRGGRLQGGIAAAQREGQQRAAGQRARMPASEGDSCAPYKPASIGVVCGGLLLVVKQARVGGLTSKGGGWITWTKEPVDEHPFSSAMLP